MSGLAASLTRAQAAQEPGSLSRVSTQRSKRMPSRTPFPHPIPAQPAATPTSHLSGETPSVRKGRCGECSSCLRPSNKKACLLRAAERERLVEWQQAAVSLGSNGAAQVGTPAHVASPPSSRQAGRPARAASASKAASGRQQPRKRRRQRSSSNASQQRVAADRNAFVAACMAEVTGASGSEGDDSSDWSDLDDFIVCQPRRDYGQLISSRFRYRAHDEEEAAMEET